MCVAELLGARVRDTGTGDLGRHPIGRRNKSLLLKERKEGLKLPPPPSILEFEYLVSTCNTLEVLLNHL